MDNSLPSEVDYTIRVASENNIEMSIFDPLALSSNNIQSFNFTLPLSQPLHVVNKSISDPMSNSHLSISLKPSPPMVIPYDANVLADSSL